MLKAVSTHPHLFFKKHWTETRIPISSLRCLANYRIMIENITSTAKALSDPNRVRALAALRGQELCVCRLIELLKLAPSTVSKHLTILKQAGLIEGRKESRWMHYRLPDDKTSGAWETLNWLFQSLGGCEQIEADQKKLDKIMSIDLDELTQIYRK